jgi:DNA-binding IclR family transcriptional regulator
MKRTNNRRRVYDYYQAHWQVKGYAPTLNEVATYCGVSSTSVHRHVVDLVEQGYLKFHPKHSHRGVCLTDRIHE